MTKTREQLIEDFREQMFDDQDLVQHINVRVHTYMNQIMGAGVEVPEGLVMDEMICQRQIIEWNKFLKEILI